MIKVTGESMKSEIVGVMTLQWNNKSNGGNLR